MKDLKLPESNKESIDISQINPEFNGIILVYNNNVSIGYIIYFEDAWVFSQYIDPDFDLNESADSLLLLIKSLMHKNVCTHFKVLEFEN